MIAAVAATHAALWHLFDDASRERKKIAISSISLAERVYLVEKNRLPEAAYLELVELLPILNTYSPKLHLRRPLWIL